MEELKAATLSSKSQAERYTQPQRRKVKQKTETHKGKQEPSKKTLYAFLILA
jgi:hypothetical protein